LIYGVTCDTPVQRAGHKNLEEEEKEEKKTKKKEKAREREGVRRKGRFFIARRKENV